jgi:hypothetical protein
MNRPVFTQIWMGRDEASSRIFGLDVQGNVWWTVATPGHIPVWKRIDFEAAR